MQKLIYTVQFLTPAFLGNAFQQGQWRTPPFKALLRQWWRVTHAQRVGYDINRLRQDEASLFGSASDHTGTVSGKSRVLIKLSHWQEGTLKSWQGRGCRTVRHSEVQGGRDVGADLYLGYGPLTYTSGQGTVLSTVRDTREQRTAVEPEQEKALLMMAVPEGHAQEIRDSIRLVSWFGTLGSRSRNGWGSLQLHPQTGTAAIPELTHAGIHEILNDFEQCFHRDWPHAIGRDERGPLVWRTELKNSWQHVMQALAEVKIAFRTSLSIAKNNDVANPVFDDRHVLAYPVTHHGVMGWVEMNGSNIKTDRHGFAVQSTRLANQLRFKVLKVRSQYQGIIVHLPYALPYHIAEKLSSAPATEKQIEIWRRVHNILDNPTNGLFRL